MRFRLPAAATLALSLSLVATGSAAALFNSFGPIDGVAAQPTTYANCSQCHIGNAVNGGDGSLVISGVPAEYTPGTTYTLTVTLQDPGQARWGFELVALDQLDANAGSLAAGGPDTQVSTDILGRQFVKHTSSGTHAGTLDGPVSWTFDWKSPPAGTGTVSFFCAGNAADNDLSPSGDFIYTAATASAELGSGTQATLVLQPDSPRPRRGTTLAVRARIRNHQASASSTTLVSRLRLPNGNTFPATGWLLPPIPVSLPSLGQGEADMLHAVPITAPLITATYEAFIGSAGNLVSQDSFTVTVLP